MKEIPPHSQMFPESFWHLTTESQKKERQLPSFSNTSFSLTIQVNLIESLFIHVNLNEVKIETWFKMAAEKKD